MKTKIGIILTFIAGFAFAQQDVTTPEKSARPIHPQIQRPARPDTMSGPGDFKENIEDLKIAKLKRVLELTPEQAGKFFTAYYEQEDVLKSYALKRNKLSEELNKMSGVKDADENVLKQKLNEFDNIETEMHQKTIEYRRKLQEGLTVKQRIKLISFERQFNKYLTEMAKGVRDRNRPEGKQ